MSVHFKVEPEPGASSRDARLGSQPIRRTSIVGGIGVGGIGVGGIGAGRHWCQSQ
jgi:hypothetical protein